LDQACPKHHRLRHTTTWQPVGATHHSPPGWLSPTGRYYPSEQHNWEPPHWPEDWNEPDNREGPDSPQPNNPDWGDGIEPDSNERPGSIEEPRGHGGPDIFRESHSLEGLDPSPPAAPLPVDPFPDWLDSLDVLNPPPPGEPLPVDSLPVDPFPEWAQFTAA
jgi:hypothetical protein